MGYANDKIINDMTFIKETLRYLICMEAYNNADSIKVYVKSKSLIDSEFKAAVSMCIEENSKSIMPIYYRVKVLDRASFNIIKEVML